MQRVLVDLQKEK